MNTSPEQLEGQRAPSDIFRVTTPCGGPGAWNSGFSEEGDPGGAHLQEGHTMWPGQFTQLLWAPDSPPGKTSRFNSGPTPGPQGQSVMPVSTAGRPHSHLFPQQGTDISCHREGPACSGQALQGHYPHSDTHVSTGGEDEAGEAEKLGNPPATGPAAQATAPTPRPPSPGPLHSPPAAGPGAASVIAASGDNLGWAPLPSSHSPARWG